MRNTPRVTVPRQRYEQPHIMYLDTPVPIGLHGDANIVGFMSDAPASVLDAIESIRAEQHARVRTGTVIATRCDEDGCNTLTVNRYCAYCETKWKKRGVARPTDVTVPAPSVSERRR